MPRVVLERSTDISLVAKGARECYKSVGDDGGEKDIALLKKICSMGHNSVMEHAVFTFRISDVSRALSHQLVRHRIASYCLSGDATVVAFKGGPRKSSKKWTMRQLYAMSKDPKRKSRLGLIRLRSVDDNGIIIPNTIESIVFSGNQVVYEVTTQSGRVIKSTMAHRFLTPEGYTALENLSVGDVVICNGIPAHKNKEWIFQKYIVENMERKDVAVLAGVSDACLGVWIRKFGLQKERSNYPNRKPGRGKKGAISDAGRAKLSAMMSGENNPKWLGDGASANAGRLRCQKMYATNTCQACGATSKLERHHMDKNPHNNEETNIMVLCEKCHKAFHHGQGVLSVFKDKIVSIKEVGIEDTYDIEMTAPYHNFVADGFVVHNSQASQRYVKQNEPEYIKPHTVEEMGGYAEELYEDVMEVCWDAYNRLVAHGIPKEDARYVLPNATKTSLVMTMNFNSLRNFMLHRLDKSAQWEIRELASDMFYALPPIYREILEQSYNIHPSTM